MSKKRRLFFDLETSFNIGFFWRAGYKQAIPPENIIEERKIICVCWSWEGDDQIHELHWDENQCDKKLLKDFIKVVNQAHEIVAHNGDRFDIKWLRTRCLYHRLPMFPKYESLDTLKQAKSLFLFNSNKLDYIAKFLGEAGKMEHEGINLWKSIILNKDADALDRMIAYCKQDVDQLKRVFTVLNGYTKPSFHYGVIADEEKYSCPECGNPFPIWNKTYTTSMGTPRHYMKCNNNSCGKRFPISNKTYMLYLKHKSRKKYSRKHKKKK